MNVLLRFVLIVGAILCHETLAKKPLPTGKKYVGSGARQIFVPPNALPNNFPNQNAYQNMYQGNALGSPGSQVYGDPRIPVQPVNPGYGPFQQNHVFPYLSALNAGFNPALNPGLNPALNPALNPGLNSAFNPGLYGYQPNPVPAILPAALPNVYGSYNPYQAYRYPGVLSNNPYNIQFPSPNAGFQQQQKQPQQHGFPNYLQQNKKQ